MMLGKSILATTFAAVTLLAGQSAFAAAYSGTGAGSSTVGAGGDYASIKAACDAVNAVGTRDASAWSFLITGDITETANSFITCTVDPAGSITFRPAPGVRAQVNWPLLADNAGTSGRFIIGGRTADNVVIKTDNIILDGCNTPGGTSRDLAFIEVALATTSGYMVRVRGNSDNIQVRNMILQNFSQSATASGVAFSSDGNDPAANKCPDDWVVDNCYIQSINSTSGAGIHANSAPGGTVPAGQAQTGWSITNNTIYAGSRSIFLNQSASGTVSGNTIRVASTNGVLGYGVYHLSANSSTGYVMNITNNVIDFMQNANVNAGELGINGILSSPGTGASNTINISNNAIGGWAFSAAATDGTYRGITVGTAPNTTNVNIFNNSINMNATSSVTAATLGRVHAIARTAGSATLNVNNNIIRYLATGTNSYAIYASAAGDINLSGNNVVIGGTSAGFTNIGATTQTTFAGYQTLDPNAQNIDPTTTTGGRWASAADNNVSDLHFTGAPVELVNSATATSILTDVDGEVRAANALPGADVVNASSSYTWNGSVSNDMGVAANWSPSRTSPKWNDVLLFNGGVSHTVYIKDQHIGGLQIASSTDVTLRTPVTSAVPGAAALNSRLSILNADNGSGNELVIFAGSTLRINGTNSVRVDLLGGATGAISGDVILANGMASAVQQIISRTPNGLAFNSGSTMAVAHGFSGGGSPFGSSTTLDGANGSVADSTGVVFKLGSSYFSGGLKDGTPTAASPSNPFAGTAPNSFVEFKSNSSFVMLGTGTPSISGRTFGYGGNVVSGISGTVTPTGANAWTIGGDLVSAVPATTAGAFNIGLTGGGTTVMTIGRDLIVLPFSGGIGDTGVPASANAVVDIKGDVDIQDAALFAPSISANRVYQLSGSSAQDINFAGDTLINLTIDNAAGVTMSGDLGISGALVLTSGDLAAGANTLTLGEAATVTGTGQIFGNLARIVDATVTGARTLPIGQTPVTFDITTAGSGTGTIAVSLGAFPSQPLPIGVIGTPRSWNLTATGITGWTATLVFNYSDSELGSANENNLVAARYNGSSWDILPSTLNTTNNTVTVTGVTALSEWTLVDNSTSVNDWVILHE